jgi:hypothetical protein
MIWEGWLAWLENSSVAVTMRESAWLYPAVETLHIIGLVLLVGAATMFDLRLLGMSPRLPVDETARHLLPWARAAFFVVLPTGLLLFSSDATALWTNPALRVKVLLIGIALVNAFIFHHWSFRSVRGWNQNTPTPIGAKVAAVISIMSWIGVISSGRLIAYF